MQTAERVESCWKEEEATQALAQKIAVCMDGWEYDFEAGHDEPGVKGYRRPCRVAWIKDGDRGQIHLWIERHRVRISGGYPRLQGEGCLAPRDPIGITVADTRGPAAIAREIERRFLPGYLEELGEAQAQKLQAESYRDAKNANAKRAAASFGVNDNPGQGRSEPLVYGAYTDDTGEEHAVTVDQFNADGGRMVFHAPTRVIEAVAALLKGLKA